MYKYYIKPIRVVDGDTVDVMVDLGFNVSKKVRVRLLGIDAPETRTKDLDEKKKGREAKAFTTVLLTQNNDETEVVLESTKIDSFGRSLGYIYINGKDLGEILIKNGYAKEYKR